jgi:hypothetical protein
MCYPEFMDILKKFFSLCHRCIRYYLLFDKNVIPFDMPVTKTFEGTNFEAARKKDDEEYDLDDIKEQIATRKGLIFGQFINFVNYFSQFGGFDAILEVLKIGNEVEEKIPLDWIASLTAPFRNCNSIFSPSFTQ